MYSLICLFALQSGYSQGNNSVGTTQEIGIVDHLLEWIQPTAFSAQYAGNIGFGSAGPVWNLSKEKLELSALVGFLPEAYSRTDHIMLTLKLNYHFKTKIVLDEKTVIKPFSFAILSSRYFNEHFNRYKDDKKYEDYHYRWSTYVRYGFSNDIYLFRTLDNEWFKKVGVYLNTSIWDLEINSLMAHKNYKSEVVQFKDLITFGIGSTIYLR